MAKLKSPLLSFTAHGLFGDLLVYFNRHGQSYVRSKPEDPVSLSLRQDALRDCFISAAISAHSLTQGQKDAYAALAPDSAMCPWWNNFIGEYIKDNYVDPTVVTTFIESIQIVTDTILDGNDYVDASMSAINKDVSAAIPLGCAPANNDKRNGISFVSLIDSTTVRFQRNSVPKVGTCIVSCLVLEFKADLVVSRQVKGWSFGSGDVEATKEITAVDMDKSLIWPSGGMSPDNVDINVYSYYLDFQDSTHLRARRSTSGSATYCRTTVIEFT